MKNRRVVITGMGVVSPIGLGVTAFWDNLLAGHSGVGCIDRFDASDFPVKIAAQVKDFKAEDFVSRREARRMDRFVQYACAAARMAVEDAGLVIEPEISERVGVWIGSGIGGLESLEKQHENLLKKGSGSISPFFIPMLIANMASGQVSILTGARGPNGCTVTACATATNSIGEAFQFIKRGEADIRSPGSEASITPWDWLVFVPGGLCLPVMIIR